MTKLSKIYLLTLILQIAGFNALAQLPDYQVQMIAKKTGLPSSDQIRDIIKDDKGFLWMIVASKVQRFDGRNFLRFSFDDVCVSITQDEGGIVWVVTRQNIYRFVNDHKGFEEIPGYSTQVPLYRRLISGPGRNLYLLNNDGITRWNKQSKKFEPFGIRPFISTGSFPALKSFGDYLFYKRDDSTLARYNTVTSMEDQARVTDPNFIFPLNGDSVWAREHIGSSVLVSFTARTITPIAASQVEGAGKGDLFFISGSIRRSPDEYLVLINNKGCFAHNTSKKAFKKINFFYDGLLFPIKPVPTQNNFYQEDKGRVWIVNDDGLLYFNPSSYTLNLLSSNGEWNDDIKNFAEDNQHNIWFSTSDGFCKWDKTSGKVSVWAPKYDVDNYLNYSSIRSIGFSGNKVLIGQSEKGFWTFDPLTQVFKRLPVIHDSLYAKFNRDFNHNGFKLRNGNFLALSNRTWLIEKGTFVVREVKLPDSIGASRAGYEDEQGRIWLAGRQGIFVVDSNFNELYSLADKTIGKWCNAIVQIDAETFWVAAKNVFEVKLRPNRKLELRRLFPELQNVHFSHFFKDSLQRIWMSNEEGLYRYVPEKKLIEKFDRSDNIKSFYVSVSNSFRGGDGTVYFGSTDGINYFVPEKIPLQNDSLQILLLNVTVNHDDSSFQLHHVFPELSYNENALVFDFIAPYVYNAEKIQYRCKLEGADQDWISVGNNTSMRFTSLSPGKYKFNAAASLNGQDWYSLAVPFSFEINPPFWKTWWFISLTTLAIAVLTIALFRRRIAIIKTRAEVQQQMLALEIRALRSQMNPHFIFNSLNSISQLVASKRNEEGLQYLSKFSKLLRLILDESEKSFISIKDEMRILDLYLQLETLRFGSSFSYTIHADEALDEEETLLPSFLIHPIIENAIWHGLLHKEGERRLIINFQKNGADSLLCIVKDNGIGIDAASKKKQQQLNGEKQESKGLKMVKERLAILEEQHHAHTSFRLEDLKDDNGYISGTKCTLEIPVMYE